MARYVTQRNSSMEDRLPIQTNSNYNKKAKVPQKTQMHRSEFYIVGIGLSIGGIEPLCKIVSHLAEKSNAAFLIIQHLHPSFPSRLAERLQQFTRIKVIKALNGQVIEQGHIYVLAEGQMMTLKGGTIVIRERKHDETVNKAVDILFESMAKELGKRAISIILSGLDSDGALGTTQINLHGGITIAQLPVSAEFPSMPMSAISSGRAHFILSPEEIAATITSIVKA
jgi:chemotaxis response regulator CheB